MQQVISQEKEAAKRAIIRLSDESAITRRLQLQDKPLHGPIFNRFMAQPIAQAPHKRPIILTISMSKDCFKSTTPDVPKNPLNQAKHQTEYITLKLH